MTTPITGFITEIARALHDLEPGWSVKEVSTERQYAILGGPNYNLFLTVLADIGSSRAIVYPDLPRDARGAYVNWYPYQVSRPEASFSMGRAPKSIAKDIFRKVITPFNAMWDGPDGIRARIEGDRNYHTNITESYRRAYAVAGRQPPQHLADNHDHSIGYASLDAVEIRPYATEWEIKFRLPIDEAEEFVRAMMKRHQDEQKASQRSTR